MNRDVFLSILAMDSYHRVPTSGFKVEGNVGDAVFVRANDRSPGSDLSGFFATAYRWNGEKIISYAGTNDREAIGPDKIFGWVNALGLIIPNGQLYYAFELYNQVTGGTIGVGPAPNTTLVGHSLGGGLAGTIAALTGTRAALFDHMPFGVSAAVLGLVGGIVPTAQRIQAYSVEGEMLQLLRLGSAALALPFYSGVPILARSLGRVATDLEEQAMLNVAAPARSIVPSYGDYRSPVDLHAPGLMTILLYAEGQHTAWQPIGKSLMDALFNNKVAEAAGINAELGRELPDAWDSLQRMIAYSAIDTGARPFGDIGIRAMFDDADEVGARAGASSVLTMAPALMQASVQFAGHLANKEIEGFASRPEAKGVITYDVQAQRLTATFADALWSSANGGTLPTTIVGRDSAVQIALGAADADFNVSQVMQWLWGAADSRIIDEIEITTTDQNRTFTVGRRDVPNKVTLVVAGGGVQTPYRWTRRKAPRRSGHRSYHQAQLKRRSELRCV